MTAITATTTGDWDSTGSFTPAQIPVSGDTVTIADGVTLTIPSGYTAIFGASPGDDVSTPALQCASSTGTGILIIDGTMQFRGSIKQANATWIANAGASIVHDSSLAAGNPSYTWQIGMAANQANAELHLLGTGPLTDRVNVSNFAGSDRFSGWTGGQTVRNGTHSVTGGFSGSGRVTFKWATLTALGETGIQWLTSKINNDTNTLIFENVLSNDCTNYVVVSNVHGGAVFREIDTSWLNPNGNEVARIFFNSDLTTGERTRSGVIADGQVVDIFGRDIDVDDCAFAGTTSKVPLEGNTTFSKYNIYDDVFVFNRETSSANSSMPLDVVMNRLVSLTGAGGGDKDHFRSSAGIDAGSGVDGAVFEFNGSNSNGDIFVIDGNPASVRNFSVKNTLSLPNTAGTATGSLAVMVTAGGAMDNIRLTVENNTMIGAGNAAVYLCEATTLGVGSVESIQNNLMYGQASQSGLIQNESTTTPDNDSITVADFNASFNISTVDQYISVDAIFGSPPGTNDIIADPEFVDDTRDFLSWGQSLDGSITTWDDIWQEIKKRNDDTGFDSRFDWKDFYTWAREGFAPQNSDYGTSGSSGGLIGAIEVFTPSAGGISRLLRLNYVNKTKFYIN